jgi:hypothetical protein
MKRDYDVKVRVKELKLGDLVYQLDTATVKTKTLSPSWKGPGVVIEKLTPYYLYTFTMIPFFALLSPDHELPSIWLPTNTIKLISIPPLISW